MPDGRFHSPIFTPYVLYSEIDNIYGWKAYNARNGFTAAQASLNAIETLGYLAYLYVVWKHGEGPRRILSGGWGVVAALVGFALSVMILSKTILYGKRTSTPTHLRPTAASHRCALNSIDLCSNGERTTQRLV